MFDKMQGIGAHEVVIETPEHALSITELSEKAIEQVLWAFRERVKDLKNDRRLTLRSAVQKSGRGGGRDARTHAFPVDRAARGPEARTGRSGRREGYYDFKERCIFCDLIRQEAKSRARIVTETDRFVVLEPYAARFPFETWILPKQHRSHFEDADARQPGKSGLGSALDAAEDREGARTAAV